jgi:K+-sensing histidine kinase KdpD
MLRKLAIVRQAFARHPEAGDGALMRAAHVLSVHIWQTLAALALVGITTLIYAAIGALGMLNFIPVAYLVPVIIAATRWGAIPAIAASIGGFLASDYFFYAPYYSLAMDDPQEVVDLLLFLFVALVTSNLATHLKRDADALRRSKRETRDLYDFSRRLAACFTVSDIVFAIQTYLSNTLEREAFLISAPAESDLDSHQLHAAPEHIHQEAAAMIDTGDPLSRTIFDPTTRHIWLLTALSTETAYHGVIAVDLGSGPRANVEIMRRQVDAMLGDAAITLERLDLLNAMNEAKLRQQSDTLKEALVGSVSHELRTPLTAILGSASVLDKTPELQRDDRIRQLVTAMYDEAKHLDNDIQNLINATRIAARDVQPRVDWVDPTDIVNAAIKQRSRRLTEHQIGLQLDNDLPLVKVESVLLEQALGQLLENAAKYSPSGSTITVSVRASERYVLLTVSDEGAGLTAEERQKLGRRAFRGSRHLDNIPGSGLGLWIARTFIAANGGTLEAASRGPGLGTEMSIRLPAVSLTISQLAAAAP